MAINFNDPAVMNAQVQQAMDYLAKMMLGPQGIVTRGTADWVQRIANQLGGIIENYDDSWVRPYLGYGNQNATLNQLERQLRYAAQRAQNTGALDMSWMPTSPMATPGTPSLPQREFALNWMNVLRQYNPESADFNALFQYLQGPQGGVSPVLQELQRRAALMAADVTGSTDWLSRVQGTPSGTPTAQQALADLAWALTAQELQGRTFNPATGQWTQSAPFLQSSTQTLLPSIIEGVGGAGDWFRQALANAAKRLQQVYGRGTTGTTTQANIGESDRNALRLRLKQTAKGLGSYELFRQDVEKYRPQLGDDIADDLLRKARKYRFNWSQLPAADQPW